MAKLMNSGVDGSCFTVSNGTHADLNAPLYLRQRLNPQLGDELYLHLSDLLLALRQHSTDSTIRLLDFGSGGSPYRNLFPNASYFRADLPGQPAIDFEIDAEGRIPAPSGHFDLVLSTQVLEHCPSPQVYLLESNRILKRGGRLILTTHGLFEEHGCPFDFQRWTEDGLRRALSECGFVVKSLHRLTSGPRAGLTLMQRSVGSLGMPNRSTFSRVVWSLCRRLILRRSIWNPLMDKFFAEYRISDESRLPGDTLYLALLAVAEVPQKP